MVDDDTDKKIDRHGKEEEVPAAAPAGFEVVDEEKGREYYQEQHGNLIPTTTTGTTSLTKRQTSTSSNSMRQKNTQIDMWKEICKQNEGTTKDITCDEHSIYYGLPTKVGHNSCKKCMKRDKEYIRYVRTLAQEYSNVYSWIALDPKDFNTRYYKDIPLLFLSICIQVIVPISIAYQLADNLEDRDYCPHYTALQKDVAEEEEGSNNANSKVKLAKLLAFTLSFYFGVISIVNFLGKIRGNTFLLYFIPSLSYGRRCILIVGFISQTIGLMVANIAEYLLFVTRGSNDFLLLLFTSLTMQSTLNVDSTFVSRTREIEASNIISKLLSDDILFFEIDNNDNNSNNDNNNNDDSSTLPKQLVRKLYDFRRVYNQLAFLLFLYSLFLTVAVTYCI